LKTVGVLAKSVAAWVKSPKADTAAAEEGPAMNLISDDSSDSLQAGPLAEGKEAEDIIDDWEHKECLIFHLDQKITQLHSNSKPKEGRKMSPWRRNNRRVLPSTCRSGGSPNHSEYRANSGG
jgi:hypothetical protein